MSLLISNERKKMKSFQDFQEESKNASYVGKKSKFKIFGDTYDTSDGTAVRDFIHIDDLSHAHYLAYNYIKKGGLLVSRCFISSKNVINSLKTNNNTTYLVSSNGEQLDYDSILFLVNQEIFIIIIVVIRLIDVINV